MITMTESLVDISPSQMEGAALARVDDLATRAVGWIAPIHFQVAQTEGERQVAYRLRYQAVIEHGWYPLQDFPAGLERDAYDDRAIHILAWDGDQPVATCRFILPEVGMLLPTEEAFELCIEPPGQVVDAGRFVVARAYSSIEHRLLASLLARTWLEVRSHGFSRVCAAFASKAMIRVFGRMGFRFRVLAQPRYYWGTERSPILFDVPESASGLIETWLTPPPNPQRL